VQFRNIWYRDLPERPVTESEHPDNIPEYSTSGGPWTLPSGDQYQPEQINPGGEGTTGTPPGDADVLIDGSTTIQPGDGDWVSDSEYGDAQVHLEYRIPEDVEGEGPLRGNSGVLMMGKYEIQILDTHENPVEADEWAGAYTHQNGPNHDSVREPGEWQQLDLVWQAPRFSGGELDKPAQVTAFLNGVAVQTRLVVDGSNEGFAVNPYNEHGKMPLHLREDGSEIDFQNVWIREEDTQLTGGEPTEPEQVSAPFGFDAGGSFIDGTVTIDGLDYVADSSSVTASGDPSASSTDTAAQPNMYPDPPNPIEGTEHDALYQTEMFGGDLTLDVEIENGLYEVTLYFAETSSALTEGDRVFDISIQGTQVLSEFDIYSEAGGHNIALSRTFSDIEVTDGVLTISTNTISDNSKICGLEIREINKVGHWTFEAGNVDGDTVLDRSEYGHDGTINGGVTTDLSAPTPATGGAAEFNGTDGTVVVPDAEGLDPGAYTVSAWVKTDGTGPWAAVLGKGGSMWCGFENQTGLPRFDPYNGAEQGDFFTSDTAVDDGNWHHVVYRHAPSEDVSSIYIDGQMAGSLDAATESPDSDTPLAIASKSQTTSGFKDWFSGAIADVRLYNVPLSESKITMLSQQG